MQTVGAKFNIEGESEYTRSLNTIKAALKSYDAQLKLVSESHKTDKDSMEALSEKQAVLGNKGEMLAKKLELLEKAHQRVSGEQGENSIAAINLTTEIAKLETEIIKNNEAIDKNSKKAEENQSFLGKMLSKIRSVISGIDKESDSLDENTDKVKKNGEESEKSFTTTSLAAYEAAKAIAEKLVSAVIDLVTASAEAVDNLNTLATTSGLNVEQLQELEYASKFVDVSVNDMTNSIKKLDMQMGEALTNGSGEAAAAFKALDVQLYSGIGTVRSADEVWQEVLVKLGNIPNETEKNRIAMKLMGENAKELNGIMGQDGVNALKMYSSEARNSGYVMNSVQMKALQDLNDEYDRSKLEIQAVKNQIAAELAPTLIQLSRHFTSVLEAVKPFIINGLQWILDHASDIGKGLIYVVGGLVMFKIVGTLTSLLQSFNSVMGVTNAVLSANPATLVAIALAGAVALIAAALYKWAESSAESARIASEMGDDLSEGMKQAVNEANKIDDGLKEAVDAIDWRYIQKAFGSGFSQAGKKGADSFKQAFAKGLGDLGELIKESVPSEFSFDGFRTNLSEGVYAVGTSSARNESLITAFLWDKSDRKEFISEFINALKYSGTASHDSQTPAGVSSVIMKLVADGRTLAEIIWDPLMKVAKQKGVELINQPQTSE